MASISKKVTLVVPGFLGKLSTWHQQYDISLDTPSLRTLLSCAKFTKSPINGLINTLNSIVPLPSVNTVSNTHNTYYIEPIFLEEGIGHLIAREQYTTHITNEESMQLTALLEPVLQDYQLTLTWLNSCFGTISSNEELNVSSLGTMDIIGDNLLHHMPEGEKGKAVRQLLNLIQMQLFDCDLNKRRISNGLLPINSVWIWQTDHSEKKTPLTYDHIIGDNALLQAVCTTHSVSYQPLPREWNDLDDSESALILLDNGFFKQKNDDINQWIAFMHDFEKNWCQPILHELQTGKNIDITLMDDDGREFSLRKKAWWKPRAKTPELITWASS